MKHRTIVLFFLLVSSLASNAVSQSPPADGAKAPGLPDVERVRTLYAAASYEEALAAMPAEASGAARVALEQYRALCLLALGREEEAVAAVERLVTEDPTYVPPDTETSPRMRSMFTKVRADLVPRLARESYAEARSAFAAQDGDTARAKFQRTIDIIDHLPEAERASLADLRLLAAGFLDLATARPAPPPPAPAPELPPAPAPAPEYVGPVVITEQLPAWVPPDGSARWTEFNGLLRVEIDEAGNVTAVHVVESSHPAYDAALVRAAKEWTYQPATRAGRAVASEKSIKIRLVPR